MGFRYSDCNIVLVQKGRFQEQLKGAIYGLYLNILSVPLIKDAEGKSLIRRSFVLIFVM